MISLDKEYETRDGRPVKLFMVDGGGNYPVLGAIFSRNEWTAQHWTAEGQFSKSESRSDLDLVEKPKTIKGWINMYKNRASIVYSSKELADEGSCSDRIACIQVGFKEGDGLD